MNNITELKNDDFRLVIMPCSGEKIPPESRDDYNKTYQLWRRVWCKTLEELEGLTTLHSNEFTRHDFVKTLFYKDKAIAMICYSHADLSIESRRDDHWFKPWPDDLKQKLSKKYPNSLLAAWFCVTPELRKSKFISNIKPAKIILESLANLVVHENLDSCFGISRNERSVNKLTLSIGGTIYGESEYYNCEVNLFLIKPKEIKIQSKTFSSLSNHIWNNRIDYRRINNEQHVQKSA